MAGQDFEYSIDPSRIADLGIDDPTDGGMGDFVSSYEMPSISAEYPPPLPEGMQPAPLPPGVSSGAELAKSLNSANKHQRNGGSHPSTNRWTREDHSDWLASNLGFGSPRDHEVDYAYEGGLNEDFYPDDLSTHEIVANDVLNKWEESPHWDESGGAGAAWESPMGHRIERVARSQNVDPRDVRGDWDDFEPFGPRDAMFPGNPANPMFHYQLEGPSRGTEYYDTWDDAADTANWDAQTLADEIAGKTFAVGRHLDDIVREQGMRTGSLPDNQMIRDAEARARKSY